MGGERFSFNVSLIFQSQCTLGDVHVTAIVWYMPKWFYFGKLVKGFCLPLSRFLFFIFWERRVRIYWKQKEILGMLRGCILGEGKDISCLLDGTPVVIQPNIACLYLPVALRGKHTQCQEASVRTLHRRSFLSQHKQGTLYDIISWQQRGPNKNRQKLRMIFILIRKPKSPVAFDLIRSVSP